MVLMNTETRSRFGIVVATRVETAEVRLGSNQGLGGPLGGSPSLARHLSPSDPDAMPGSRLERAYPGAPPAATRAGRPGGSAGVLPRPGLASIARRASLSDWSPAGKPGCAHRWSCGRFSTVDQQPRQQGMQARPPLARAALSTNASLGSWSVAGSARKSAVGGTSGGK
jgi:hypothetical protein